MALHPFAYHRPETLPEALTLLADHGERSRALAGGTDLVPKLREGRVAVDHLVSLNRVADLDRVEVDAAGALVIGATARLSGVGAHPAVAEAYPALAHACAVMATPQIRNMGTVAGNLANGSPCADTAAPLLVYDAELEIASAAGGVRRVPLRRFHRGPGDVDLRPGDLVTAVRVRRPSAGARSGYQRASARSQVDISAVGVAALLVLDPGGSVLTARLALSAVAPTPMRCPDAEALLTGAAPTPARFAQAAAACAAASRPIDDVRAPATWRRHMVGVLARRVLARCLAAHGEAAR